MKKSYTKPVVAGLASYGMSGMVFHAPLLHAHPGFILKSVVQRSRLDAVDRYPGIKIEKDFKDLLQDDEIELIVVNATNDTHLSFTKSALEAGKHVVVEKPFVNTVKDGRLLLELAEKTGLVVTHMQPDFLALPWQPGEVTVAWRDAENLWRARASVVAFVKVAPDRAYYPLVEASCAVVVARPERFAKTAVGWILREISRHEEDFVRRVLDEHIQYFSAESLKNATKYLDKDGQQRYRQRLKNAA